MDPISGTERLVMLLRQKLAERAKTSGAGKPAARQMAGSASPVEAGGLGALAAMDGVYEREFRRAVIHSILADQLGPDLINEAQFQNIVTRVLDAIEADTDAARMLREVAADLRRA